MHHANRLILLVLLLLGFPSSFAPADQSEPQRLENPDVLRLAIRLTDVASRKTAIVLSSLAGFRQSGFDIDTTWVRPGDDVVDRLEAKDVELALLPLEEIGSEPPDDHPNVRAVMRFWTLGGQSEDGTAHPPMSHLLLAHSSLPADRVEALLDVTLRDHVVLQAARIDVTRLTPDEALTELPIAAHEGVADYLLDRGTDLAAAAGGEAAGAVVETGGEASPEVAPQPSFTKADLAAARLEAQAQGKPQRSFTLYFGTADASIDDTGFQSVADACRFAASLPQARFVISGHADTVGTEVYNDDLSSRRARAVAKAIRNDPRFREVLSVVEFGERRLAVVTGDDVDEPMNRRVEITVFQDE